MVLRKAREEMNFKKLLETYTFEELLELDDMTLEEALEILYENGYLKLPEAKPVDV